MAEGFPITPTSAPESSLPMRTVSTPLGPLAYAVLGPADAPTTVVLWPSIFTDHRIYDRIAPQLAATYRVVLVDGFGHGRSGGPTEGTFSMKQCADALALLMDRLGVRRGIVGAELALRQPDRVDAVILLNTPIDKAAHASLSDRLITWGARWMSRWRLFTDGVARTFFSADGQAAQADYMAHFHAMLHEADPEALSTAVRSVLIGRESLVVRLPSIAVPTLILAGRQDDMYPIDSLRGVALRMPQAQFVAVDSRHISVVDNPAAVLAALQSLLTHAESARRAKSP